MDIKKENVARLVRWIALTVFLSISFTLFFSAAGSAGMMPFSLKTTKDQLNIRVKPDTYSDILTVIEKTGTALYPVDETSQWYKIRFANHLYGYVYKDYVVQGDACPTKVSLFPGAALRTAANATAKIHTICSTGAKVSVLTYDDTWYYVTTYRGEQGYMLKSSAYEPAPAYPLIRGREVQVSTEPLLQVTSNTAIVRSGPSSSSGQVVSLNSDTILFKSSQTTGNDGYTWYKISTLNKKTGYIRGDLVKEYSLAGKTIVIDAGHGSYKSEDFAGGIDKGNIGPTKKLEEKDTNLEISLYLRAYLEASGATVVLCRPTDVGVFQLSTRAQVANENNADIFISVHCNASTTDSKKKGVITYYFGGNAATPVNATLLAKRKALAADVQNALLAENGGVNLGTGSDAFTVLVKSTMPSILVEVAYITNPEEEALLATAAYQELCGKGIYKGVLNYFETY